MDVSFTSAVVILLLVMDPVGNIPLFVSLLRNVEPRRRGRVILRECAIAYAVLLVSVVFGRTIMAVLGISDSSLTIAGGVILFLIALRMVFHRPEGVFGVFGTTWYYRLDLPGVKEFVEKYQKTYPGVQIKVPGNVFLNG